MVKNTTGGTGAKGLARKHQVSNSGEGKLRLPECELEIFGLVTKMLGNGMCEIKTNDDMRLIGHIRNKFRGKQKRHNLLTVNQFVLVGLREWEKPYKNCDILTMYDAQHIQTISSFPNINIRQLLLSLPDFQNDHLAFNHHIDPSLPSSTSFPSSPSSTSFPDIHDIHDIHDI
jgi:initiation factor 1A